MWFPRSLTGRTQGAMLGYSKSFSDKLAGLYIVNRAELGTEVSEIGVGWSPVRLWMRILEFMQNLVVKSNRDSDGKVWKSAQKHH